MLDVETGKRFGPLLVDDANLIAALEERSNEVAA
jgi:hypothetical protein